MGLCVRSNVIGNNTIKITLVIMTQRVYRSTEQSDLVYRCQQQYRATYPASWKYFFAFLLAFGGLNARFGGFCGGSLGTATAPVHSVAATMVTVYMDNRIVEPGLKTLRQDLVCAGTAEMDIVFRSV